MALAATCLLTTNTLASDVNTSALGQNSWYSDDTRADGFGVHAAGTNLVSPTLTDAPENAGGNPAHDADILSQVQFGAAPGTVPLGTWPGMVNLTIGNNGSGKSTISHRKDDGIGHAPASVLNDPSFSVSYSWMGNGTLTVSAGLKIGIKTSEFGLAAVSPRTGEGSWDKLLVYEPGNQVPDTSRLSDGTWHSESISQSTGRWWIVDRIPGGGNNICCPQKLQDMSSSAVAVGSRTVAAVWAVITAPGSIITNIQYGIGSGNAGGNVYVNQLQTSFYRVGDRTTFGPPAPSLNLVNTTSCYQVGNAVTVNINMADMSSVIVGGQFFLWYDVTKLAFVSASPGGGVFPLEVYEFHVPGMLDYAVGVPFGDPGTSADTTMAILTFTAIDEICNVADRVMFRPNTPPTRLTVAGGAEILPDLVDLPAIIIDSTDPVITCPSDVVVGCGQLWDPPATGVATATDCSAVTITFTEDRSGLIGCNATGTIVRTWTATDCSGNSSSCIQNIHLVDDAPPVLTACPPDITVNAEAGFCSAVVTYTPPTAEDMCYEEGFEDPDFLAGANVNASSNWNNYNSTMTRVLSGTDGIASKSGVAHALIDSTSLPASPNNFSGAFTRLRGYSPVFGTGFRTSVDVYMDLTDPAVLAETYGWDLSSAANNQANGHRRDFIFHTAGYAAPPRILVGGSNNTNFARRNDIASLSHYVISTSGWYTFESVFRDNSGVLAVDLNLRDQFGTLLWTETRTNATDLIASVVGGNRYMWFTFLAADTLAIDNTQLIRDVPVMCSLPSGSTFNTGVNLVTCTATDACGNVSNCSFDVTVNNVNIMALDIELEGTFTTNFTRCITFELYECGIGMVSVPWNVDFVNGYAANVQVEVPCGVYDCITARDQKHTLRRTGNIAINGLLYESDFTASTSNALVGGNLNDDMFIDILDFGIFVGQYNTAPGADTVCGYVGNHADIDGDGVVFNNDFTFIQVNFLKSHENNCCMLPMVAHSVSNNLIAGNADRPVVSISVKELRLRGLNELIQADLNGDGWLDQQDIAVFLNAGHR